MFNEVKSTKNYELFELVKENRDINFKYVDKLIESMKTLNLIVPILVRKNSGSKLLIVDGQHRFEASKRLGRAIHYIEVANKINVKQMRQLNENQQKWSMNDYLTSYLKSEKDPQGPYHTFAWFTNRYKFPFQINIDLLCNTPMQATSMSAFREGNITIKDLPDAIEKADFIISLKKYTKLYSKRSFVLALVIAMRSSMPLDRERFRNQLSNHRSDLYRCDSAAQYLDCINVIYNKNLRMKDRVYYNATQKNNGAYIK
tara:strand:- start:89 stop:862 length:774 start_codon:yes stop_codon:yes gene_type:complete